MIQQYNNSQADTIINRKSNQSTRLFYDLFNRRVAVANSASFLENLPLDIWKTEIFRYLSKRDICTLSSVSTTIAFSPCYQSIRIIDCSKFNIDNFTNPLKKVQKLEIISINSQLLINAIAIYPTFHRSIIKLEEIIIDNNENFSALIATLEQYPQLLQSTIKLHFTQLIANRIINADTIIEVTEHTDADKVSDRLKYLLENTPNLETLTFGPIHQQSNCTFKFKGSNCYQDLVSALRFKQEIFGNDKNFFVEKFRGSKKEDQLFTIKGSFENGKIYTMTWSFKPIITTTVDNIAPLPQQAPAPTSLQTLRYTIGIFFLLSIIISRLYYLGSQQF